MKSYKHLTFNISPDDVELYEQASKQTGFKVKFHRKRTPVDHYGKEMLDSDLIPITIYKPEDEDNCAPFMSALKELRDTR